MTDFKCPDSIEIVIKHKADDKSNRISYKSIDFQSLFTEICHPKIDHKGDTPDDAEFDKFDYQ